MVTAQKGLPAWQGVDVYWTVVDNGEGNASLPDQISLVHTVFTSGGAIAQSHCDSGFAVGLNDVFGNIQVRP
ncbi:MAG: hypothetical protein R3199_03540 [Gemmatimonadota bacterium]|nr:hypothetical protein [Gemmatimonadota bacterium]